MRILNHVSVQTTYIVCTIEGANNALQQTKTALASFGIHLSHSGLVLSRGSLPVVRARFRLLKASVRLRFLEKVYENAMRVELQKRGGLKVTQQHPLTVYYEDETVGEYFADLVVNDALILELKATEKLTYAHECQLLNYLKATNIEVGLLLNFGVKPEHKRKVFTNDKKKRSIDH